MSTTVRMTLSNWFRVRLHSASALLSALETAYNKQCGHPMEYNCETVTGHVQEALESYYAFDVEDEGDSLLITGFHGDYWCHEGLFDALAPHVSGTVQITCEFTDYGEAERYDIEEGAVTKKKGRLTFDEPKTTRAYEKRVSMEFKRPIEISLSQVPRLVSMLEDAFLTANGFPVTHSSRADSTRLEDMLSTFYGFNVECEAEDTIEITSFDAEFWCHDGFFEALAPHVRGDNTITCYFPESFTAIRYDIKFERAKRTEGSLAFSTAPKVSSVKVPSYEDARSMLKDRCHAACKWMADHGHEEHPNPADHYATRPTYVGTYRTPNPQKKLVLLLDTALLHDFNEPLPRDEAFPYKSKEELVEVLRPIYAELPGACWEVE